MTPLAVQACVLEALVMQNGGRGQMMVLVGGYLSQDAPESMDYLPT